MTWAKVDDRLYDDPRCEAAGLDAMGLFVLAMSYMGAYHTDGWITAERVRRIAGRRGVWLADKLVTAGWWERPDGTEGAYRLVGWDRYILPAEEVAERSERAAVAGRKGGRRRAERTATPPPEKVEPTPEPPANLGLNPGDNLSPSSEVRACNEAESLDTGQPTRAHPRARSRPEIARTGVRDHAREDPQGVGQAIPFGPSEVTTPPEAAAIPPGTVLPLFPTDPTTTPLPASGERPKTSPGEVAKLVHAAYLDARSKAGMKGPGPVLDAKRVRLVAARLRDFTPEDLCAAARGVWCSDWHREQGQTSLDLVLRDSAHVERFREEHDRANKPPPPDRGPFKLRPVPDVPPERIAARVAEIEAMLAERRAGAVAHG